MSVSILTSKSNLDPQQDNALEAVYDALYEKLESLYFNRTDEEVLTLTIELPEFSTFNVKVEWDEEEHFNTPDGCSDYDVVTRCGEVIVEWFDGEVVIALSC